MAQENTAASQTIPHPIRQAVGFQPDIAPYLARAFHCALVWPQMSTV